MKHDVVYILKNGVDSDEIRYSLRSIEKNFPHGSVWFFGGKPKNIMPDIYVPYMQTGATKWQRSTETLKLACSTPELSDDFWLFNDDFFILEKVKDLPTYVKGTMSERVSELVDRNGWSSYCRKIDETRQMLEQNGFPTIDYALHTPMLINKKKALEVMEKFPNCPMFRCLYGNYFGIAGERTDDVKIYDLNELPKEGQTLLSTCDTSFKIGKVGRMIKSKFPEPSIWEK